jgi:hypothetical protein
LDAELDNEDWAIGGVVPGKYSETPPNLKRKNKKNEHMEKRCSSGKDLLAA